MTQNLESERPMLRLRGRERWWLLALGLLLGFLDTWLARSLGFSFELGGRDLTPAVTLYLGLSFAGLGFLIGYLIESRRAVAAASRRIRAQMQELADLRRRLAANERLALVGQLAAGVAHEIRNPLAIVRSTAQNLEERMEDPAARRRCRFLIEEADRLANVTSSLLGLARPLEPAQSPLRIETLLDRLELLLPDELERKRLSLRRQQESSLPPVQADADLACQLLLDLLTNAAEASPLGGTITLQAFSNGDRLCVAIADEGPGVATADREHIFEPLFTTRRQGTGLGLAVARRLAECQGASLELDASGGSGARFVVAFPLAAEGAP